MSINSLTIFNQDGLELFVDEQAGRAYAHQAAMQRMFALSSKGGSLTRALKGVSPDQIKTAQIHTGKGVREVSLYSAETVFDLAIKFAPDLARRMGGAGANVFLCGMAGYKVAITQPIHPKSALELAREQVKLLEQIELQERQINLLAQANEQQAEIIDELFEYSSIIRIAKYNGCGEKAFHWSKLKAASKAINAEVKKAPCPRFGEKNLYSHDAWRLAYPGYRMPETTTLVIKAV